MVAQPNPFLDQGSLRLDANEGVWFARQLEYIDNTVYETIFAENRARQLIPTAGGIPDWARVYTWRQFTSFGKAKISANMADDIPRADRAGTEESKIIKPVTASYGWDIFEIKAAAATGTPLDALKATAARFAIESEIDEILAIGAADHNLEGLLTLASVTPTPATDTFANMLLETAPPLGPDLISKEIANAASRIISRMKQAGGPIFSRFTVIMPIEQYGLLATTRMGDGSDTTVLRFVLNNNPWIEAIEPWHHANNAAVGGATDRMVVYPRNPLVLAGIVPMEFTTQPPDQRNLEFVINCLATTGGVVVRYPVAIEYVDGV